MRHCKTLLPVSLLLGLLYNGAALAVTQTEEYKLAENYGCVACHAPTPDEQRKSRKVALPIGPSFKEIAARYHSDKGGDYQELYRIVKYGSSPFRSKWKGKVSGLAMPPNDDTISDLEINRLLVWILTTFESGKK